MKYANYLNASHVSAFYRNIGMSDGFIKNDMAALGEFLVAIFNKAAIFTNGGGVS